MQTVLVTGGAGYIGSHIVRELLKNEYKVAIIDNLSAGKQTNVPAGVTFIKGEVGDASALDALFSEQKIDAVIHLAASIEVGESVAKPIEYLENNTISTHILLKAMHKASVKNLIFSSTAAVYGIQERTPIPETASVGPLDPYGYSKLLCEHLIRYYSQSVGLNAIVFRFFNACGSDFDRAILDSHKSHLIPFVVDVVMGRQPQLTIHGNSYDTIDGTGVRDYVHVLDIARAHVRGLEYLRDHPGVSLFNIGTGNGQSVLQVVKAAEAVAGRPIPVQMGPPRAGDAPITVADNSLIRKDMGFELLHSDLKTIIETSIPTE